jgi:hypothetical protein
MDRMADARRECGFHRGRIIERVRVCNDIDR